MSVASDTGSRVSSERNAGRVKRGLPVGSSLPPGGRWEQGCTVVGNSTRYFTKKRQQDKEAVGDGEG